MSDPILDRFISDLYNSNDKVKRSRSHYARMWLEFAGEPPWSREVVLAFEKKLKDEGFAEGTVRQVYSIVKRVFDSAQAVAIEQQQKLIASIDPANPDPAMLATAIKALGTKVPTWDMGKRGAPKVTHRHTPTLTLDQLTTMVTAARTDGFEPDQKAFLALSSVYGLRRGELAAIRPEHIDYKKKTLFVMTEKGGQQRPQLIADELLPVLQAFDFKRQYSDFDLSRMWHVIEQKAGLKHEPDTGFHSIRRYLDTALKDLWGQDAMQVKIFFRWKTSSSADMSERYYHKDPLEIDREVCNKHPIVPLWRGNIRMDL